MKAEGVEARGIFSLASRFFRSAPAKVEALDDDGEKLVEDGVTEVPPPAVAVDEPPAAPKLYGPYHRRASPTQLPEHADLMEASGELWGRPPGNYFGGVDPYVKAFKGPLPPEARAGSVEFYSFEPHDVRHSPEWGAHWYPGGKGVWGDDDFAKIKIVVTKVVR